MTKTTKGKPPLHLLPAGPLRAIVSAFQDGATVYEPWDWTKVDDHRDMYVSSTMRHLLAYANPNESDYDSKSGVHHLSGAAASIMILLYHDEIDYHIPNSVAALDQPIPPFYVAEDAKQVPPNRCVAPHPTRGFCDLPAGHDGNHGNNQATWPPEPTTEPMLCGYRIIGGRLLCELPRGHIGPHVTEPDPRCSKRWDHRRCQLGAVHGGTHVYDPDKEPPVPAEATPDGIVLDARAQCGAHDPNGTRCCKDDEHEGLHESDQAAWDDGACWRGCP